MPSTRADKTPDAPPEEAFFYHSLEFDDGLVVPGVWDLRGHTAAYLGDPDGTFSWAGRSVLEVGPASGHVSLWLEAQGAEVSCLELGANDAWDFVPYGGAPPPPEYLASRRALMRALGEGLSWALARAGSGIEVHRGLVYEAGSLFERRFDVGVMAMVLLHVARPFDALAALASRCDRIVVTELFPWSFQQPAEVEAFFARAARTPDIQSDEIPARILEAIADQPRALLFAPDGLRAEPKATWWDVTPSWTAAALEVLGFRSFRCNYHLQRHDGRRAWDMPVDAREALLGCYSVVAERQQQADAVGPRDRGRPAR